MTQTEIMQLEIEARLLRYCAPIFFLPSKKSTPENIAANATIALVDTGQKRLLVTSAHVWTEFKEYKFKNPEGFLGVLFINGYGHPEFIEENLLVDFDTDLDLAIFNASPNWNLGMKEFHRVFRWPINKANENDKITFLGFAAVGRRTTAYQGQFSYSSFGLSITSVSDRKLLIDSCEDNAPVIDNLGKVVQKVNLGGMSGSPVYTFNAQGNFRLIGFVQMGSTTDSSIFVTHAYFVNQDGTLKRE